MSQDLRVGIIGTGFGTATLAPALTATPGIDLVAFCSARLPRAQEAAERFGAGLAFDDHRRMLEIEELDLVCVCAPPATHVDMASAVIESGRHVFLTKPLAPSAKAAAELLAAARTKDLIHVMDLGRRYVPARRHLRELVRSGYLGALRHVSVSVLLDLAATEGGHAYYSSWLSKRPDGGIVHASALNHYVDLVRFVFGEVTDVSGLQAAMVTEKPILSPEYDSIYGIPPNARTVGTETTDAEDTAVICGRFETGGLLSIVGSWSVLNGSGERLEAYGSAGTLVLDGANRLFGASAGDALEELDIPEHLAAPDVGTGAVPFYAALGGELVAVTRDRSYQPMFATFEDGVRLLEIGESLQRL